MMAWVRDHLGYNGSCLSEVASNQHTNTYVFLLLKLLSIRPSFPVLVLKAHVFCRPTHFHVKKSHPINACHPDSTFYPRAASAYPESGMEWYGTCSVPSIPFHEHWLSGGMMQLPTQRTHQVSQAHVWIRLKCHGKLHIAGSSTSIAGSIASSLHRRRHSPGRP